ncbi:MAG TPA: FAD:protein FMN transferase [Solirubrobacteraceae bacterium]|nr:FAD:protein FMN transferase [Solirubrobacteraceae bacterium]
MRPASPASATPGSASWEALGTGVVLRVSDPRGLGQARDAVERELAAIDRACSRFREDSELSRVNARAGRSLRTDPLLLEAVQVALRAAELTDGDVDPTIGRALEIAGYDRDWQLLSPPAGELQEPVRPRRPPDLSARMIAGWRRVLVDRHRGSIRVPAGVQLDLGATAKAWAADRAAAAAAEAGSCGALVSVGGDVATAGEAPAGGWLIRVTDDHRSDCTAPGQTICIASGAIATSSTAVRRWSHGGRTMHHIIDPRTGEPVEGTWRTVSVAAADCTDANIATTAALVRAQGAPEWLAEQGLPARLVDAAGGVVTVAGWPLQDAHETGAATVHERPAGAEGVGGLAA